MLYIRGYYIGTYYNIVIVHTRFSLSLLENRLVIEFRVNWSKTYAYPLYSTSKSKDISWIYQFRETNSWLVFRLVSGYSIGLGKSVNGIEYVECLFSRVADVTDLLPIYYHRVEFETVSIFYLLPTFVFPRNGAQMEISNERYVLLRKYLSFPFIAKFFLPIRMVASHIHSDDWSVRVVNIVILCIRHIK